MHYKQSHWLLVFILLLLFGISWSVTRETGRVALQYDYLQLQQGAYWRLMTAHFTHTTLYHLMMNSLGLILIAVIFRTSVIIYLLLMLGSLLTINLGLWLNQQIWYVGFSGVLHGLIAGLIYLDPMPKLIRYTALCLLTVKLIHEQTTEQVYQPLLASMIAVDAHLYGVIGGLLSAAAVALAHHLIHFKDRQ